MSKKTILSEKSAQMVKDLAKVRKKLIEVSDDERQSLLDYALSAKSNGQGKKVIC